MKKLLSRLIWVPLGLALVVFFVANRQLVAVSFDPFSAQAPSLTTPLLPLWVWLVAMLLIGYFLGAATSWVSRRGERQRVRRERRELHRLRRAAVERPMTTATGQDGAALPVLKAS